MSERENILARIREALRSPAPRPGAHPFPTSSEPVDPRPVLPATGTSFEENVAQFRKNAVDLKADFHLVQNRDKLVVELTHLREVEGWKKIASHKGALTDAVVADPQSASRALSGRL